MDGTGAQTGSCVDGMDGTGGGTTLNFCRALGQLSRVGVLHARRDGTEGAWSVFCRQQDQDLALRRGAAGAEGRRTTLTRTSCRVRSSEEDSLSHSSSIQQGLGTPHSRHDMSTDM